MKFTPIILLVFSITFAKAQVNESLKLRKSLEIGLSHSFLTYNLKNLEGKNSAELKLGMKVEHDITTHFKLSGSALAGIKAKAKYYYYGIAETRELAILMAIDRTLSQRNHYFIEMPILLSYKQKGLSIGSGVLGRHYFNNSTQADFLSGQYEVGSISRLSYQLASNLSINCDAYFGLTSIYSAYFLAPYPQTGGTSFKMRNNFLSLGLSFSLPSKKI
jgi:hypothetical protein